tara:strand:+ start:1536 stop:2267 length:732 start_codon:yes stop_codon:yes gene_type:complete
MSTLYLIRHGQSLWNAENRFTGWVDIDLSEKGRFEASEAGKLIAKTGKKVRYGFTSYLKRAIDTHEIILANLQESSCLKTTKAWELNEKHYGALTGLNKEVTKLRLGKDLFLKYRRSWKLAPPPISEKASQELVFSPLNINIPKKDVPNTESLLDTYKRVISYFLKNILPLIKQDNNVLITAHGNSLRALCKYIFEISDEGINNLEIPTGNPLKIDFDKEDKIINCNYLDDKRANKIDFKKTK